MTVVRGTKIKTLGTIVGEGPIEPLSTKYKRFAAQLEHNPAIWVGLVVVYCEDKKHSFQINVLDKSDDDVIKEALSTELRGIVTELDALEAED